MSENSYPDFTSNCINFLPSISRKEKTQKTERDRTELLAALKELVVRFAMVCPYEAGKIPTNDRKLIRKAERAIERAEAEK